MNKIHIEQNHEQTLFLVKVYFKNFKKIASQVSKINLKKEKK